MAGAGISSGLAGLSVEVEVEGVHKLQRQLEAITDAATAEEELRSAVRKGAEPIRDTASFRAPVGTEPVARKRLYQGIVIEEAKEGRGIWEQVAPLREVAHATLQEFGTKHHGAQPFMRPAFDEKKGEAVETVRREMKRAIERAARRA